MMAGHNAGLMPRKPSRRPATASARVDERGSSSNGFKSIRSSLNGGHMASTSIGNAQLCQHMHQMGIPFTSSSTSQRKEDEESQSGTSSILPVKVKQDSFGSHRRSVSFLELVDRNSRGPSNSPDSTLEDIRRLVPDVPQDEPETSVTELAPRTSIVEPEVQQRKADVDPNTHSVLSQALGRIAELESSLEYYERACVDATFDSDFWQKEYNRLYDIMRIAEQKQEQMMVYIRRLEGRVKKEEKESEKEDTGKARKKADRSSAATIPIPAVQPVKGDVNSHSMLEIASSSASVTTTEDHSPLASHLPVMKGLKRVTSSSTMKSKEMFALDQTMTASSTSTTTQRKQINPICNPLIAPIMQDQLKLRELGSNWDQEKRNVISKWVKTAQVSNEEKQKSKRITTIERSLKEASNIQNANELFYKGWTIDSSPQEEEEEENKATIQTPSREEDVRGRHPFSIITNSALKARWADAGTNLGLDQEQNETQAYAGLQAHSRWRVWKANMGK
ncbi:uncharacterized protein FA14DRAFT_172231 [Meira miltonrushii]|uniref:Uncharacterized protein n=1 Tax=Meira miltonrushii TaxID=1280837 RepID=A0A316VD85_9BASI|nr:uncharacterized protein FA14DRAFT_172231 [Meira miltonrushii]PWN35619.1 hypothetical protein FA14DRAFT_172231 [Meira miltonrushii]